MNTDFPIFKIQFFIVINEKYSNSYINEEKKFNSDSEINEILNSKDLETYLITKRNVRFNEQDNFKKINMKFNNSIIGFIYNLNDFNIEKYWRRTKEKYLKKLELNKVFKELKRANRKIEEEKLREKEKKQDQMFNETLKKKTFKLYQREESRKRFINRWLKYNNLFENKKLASLELKLKPKNDTPNHSNQNKENFKYIQNNDLINIDKEIENPEKVINIDKISVSESKDKLPIIPKTPNSQDFPKIENKRAQTEENKPINLIKNNKIIRNSMSAKKISNKIYKIINRNEKPKIEINNNKNFKSSKNFFKSKYILAKLELQNSLKSNRNENKNLDTNNNKKNDNILTKEHTKELKVITKKENIKKENMVKMKEKLNQEETKNKKEQEIEEIGKYNVFNIYI